MNLRDDLTGFHDDLRTPQQATTRWTCPRCEYDLRGLGGRDPITCPECGGSFTAAQVAAVRPWKWRRPVTAARIWGVIVLLVTWPMTADYLPCGAVAFCWPVALLWAALKRERGRRMLAPSIAVATAISLMSCAPNMSWWSLTAVRSMLANGIPLVIWALLWLSPPRPVLAGFFVMLALIPGVPGVALVGAASAAYINGDYWTEWNGSPEMSGTWGAFGRNAAMREGLLLLVPGVLLAGAAVIADRRHRRTQGKPGSVATGA